MMENAQTTAQTTEEQMHDSKTPSLLTSMGLVSENSMLPRISSFLSQNTIKML